MRTIRKHLERVTKLHYHYQKQVWLVDAVQTYCAGVHELDRNPASADLRSTGFRSRYEEEAESAREQA